MGKYAKTIFKQSIAFTVIFTYFRSAKLNAVSTKVMNFPIYFVSGNRKAAIYTKMPD